MSRTVKNNLCCLVKVVGKTEKDYQPFVCKGCGWILCKDCYRELYRISAEGRWDPKRWWSYTQCNDCHLKEIKEATNHECRKG